jgi:phage-related minor tail protein
MKKYPEQVYRIYTEDVRRKEIIKATSELFDNFTLHPTTGFFNGQAEKSIVIEIVKATDANIERLAHKIQELNGQKTMLVMSLTGTAAVKHAQTAKAAEEESGVKNRRALRSKGKRKKPGS